MDIRAKKSLGQNFLIDANVIQRIANLIPEGSAQVLEIGPGKGALSVELAKRCKKLFLIEKDEMLLAGTQTLLQIEGNPATAAWPADALDFDYSRIWREANATGDEIVVAANLPYNVGTEILFRLLEFRERIPRMVLMFQKEVANRLAAHPSTKAYGTISVLVQNFYETEIALKLGPQSFRPRPKVDSAVVVFTRRKSPLLPISAKDWPAFKHFIHTAFRFRRKTLENALNASGGKLMDGLSLNKTEIHGWLEQAGIDGKRRAETLSLQEFGDLFRRLREKRA